MGWRPGVVKQQPEEIPDADHELVIERVCAIDVAKASGAVCLRLPGQANPARRVSRVWQVLATTRAVTDLAAQLVAERVEKVTVESTSDYWRIWFYLLESAGLDVQLVNARDVKNLPGRPKTDLLTELPGRRGDRDVRGSAGLARFPRRDQRRGCAPRAGRVGGAAGRVA